MRPFFVNGKELPVQSQHLKYKNKLLKLFKVKDEDPKRCHWRSSSVFIVNCEHISNFVLIVHFKQANVCWVHIEKISTFKDKSGYIIRFVRYVVVFQV